MGSLRHKFGLPALIFVMGLVNGVAHAIPEDAPTPVADPYQTEIDSAKKGMMSDPASALSHARAAEDIARTQNPETNGEAIATAYWLQAEALNRLNRPAEAEPLIVRGIDLISSGQDENKLSGDLILARGRTARLLGKDEIALESFHQAHDIFARLDITRSQAIALQSLASIYQDARDYPRVLEYYERASEIHSGDPALDLSAFNNRANAERELGEYDKAIALFRDALGISEEMQSPLLTARIKANIATTMLQAGDLDSAIAESRDAVALLGGIDAAEWLPVLQGVEAQVLVERGDYTKAAILYDGIFRGMELASSNASFRELHKSAHRAYKAVGRHADALNHLEAFKRLDDASRDIAAKANTALMTAEFDFADKELEIEKLNSARLRNEVQLARTEAKLRNQSSAAIVIIAMLLASTLVAGLIFQRRRRMETQEVNKALEESNATLDRANRVKTEFLATTSHEIRTPLNGILGLTQVMLADESLPAPYREHIESIRGAGDTLLAVVNDILDVATIESGRLEISEQTTDVPALTREVVEIFQNTAKEKGLRLTVDTGDCPTSVISDAVRLRQVIFNLVSNAIKFTAKGGVHVALAIRPGPDGEHLSIKVSDTGIGIPPDKIDAIFETFSQLDSGVDRQFGGTGLGLSICRRVAQALGGEIEVKSQLGLGSRFMVTLPLKRAGQPTERTGTEYSSSDKTSVGEMDVLIVEDNGLNRIVLEALIKGHVNSVTLTEDGVQALAAIEEKHFDLILMDKQMPNMDGITAIKSIRARTDGSENVYIISVTADAYDGAREELFSAGADDYLPKPISAEALLEAIAKAIDRGVVHQPQQSIQLVQTA